LGGKTGTTNDSFDNWFMGFSPDLVVGVYVGMDTPEQMGRETGSSSAVPIVKDFLETVLKSQSKVPFRIPDGVTLAPVNRVTGEPTYIGAPDFILEAFKPGTEPTVGGLKSRTRFGSGTDSLGGFFGAPSVINEAADPSDEPAEEIAENAKEDAPVSEEGATPEGDAPEATETDANDAPSLSEILERAERAVDGETPDIDAPELGETPKPTEIEVPVPAEVEIPEEVEKPVEKALDDGLY
jgi:penicillin-binding protein 1A